MAIRMCLHSVVPSESPFCRKLVLQNQTDSPISRSSSFVTWCSNSRTSQQLSSVCSGKERHGKNLNVFNSSSSSPPPPAGRSKTRLYISGLSFRTTEEGLRNTFKHFGQLMDVNLVMDRMANRPRGFAFLQYATEEESQKAIEGMHGKFLDGRVIFVEIAKPRSDVKQG